MASEEPKDVNIYFVKGYTKCHVVLLALDKRRDAYFDITSKVKLALDENGISIPYPQRDVHLKNGSFQSSKSV